MYIRLSQNCHVRQYGPYTYILNHLNKFDLTYRDADVFMSVIGREPVLIDEAVRRICLSYADVSENLVRRDFEAFVKPLVENGCVVRGRSEQELNLNDQSFSYEVPLPSTAYDVSAGKGISEKEGQRLLHEYFLAQPTPFHLHFDLTSACTEKCVHCYVPRKKHDFIDTAKCMEVMDQLRQMEGMSVTLSGGECMLHPDFEKIIRHAQERDFAISVLSNLTLCDERKAELLKEMNVSLVQVSLYSMDPKIHDSITQLPGSFEKTMMAIELLHRMDVPVQISCPTMKQNYKGYKQVIEFADSMKMKAYTDFIIMARSDHTTDNLDNRLSLSETEEIIRTIAENEPEYRSALKESDWNGVSPEERAEEPFCGVCLDSICLNADGNFYACSGFQDYPLGNCYRQTLADVWNQSPQVLYLRSLRGKAIPECVHCKNRDYCSTCLVRNFNETGDMLKVSKHFCEVARINREIVEELRGRMNTK